MAIGPLGRILAQVVVVAGSAFGRAVVRVSSHEQRGLGLDICGLLRRAAATVWRSLVHVSFSGIQRCSSARCNRVSRFTPEAPFPASADERR